MLLESLRIAGLLSFAPDAPTIELRPLNVIIGPNGSGKSNVLEAIELLRAAPIDFAAGIRTGGGVHEWLWKGDRRVRAVLEAGLQRSGKPALDYQLEFEAQGARAQITDEVIEGESDAGARTSYLRRKIDAQLLFAYQDGSTKPRQVHFAGDQSALHGRDPDVYPELAWCAAQLARIQMFREWSFGRYSPLRQPQPADLPTDVLTADASNLGLLLNRLEHEGAGDELRAHLRRFLPRVQRLTTLVQGNTVQIFLHEEGLSTPIPATRLSDGTLRFLAMATVLLLRDPPPLICIEEPELGLHPDALALIGDLLVAASARTQVIVTTHSDALISALTDHVDSVLVCEHRGGTELKRLDATRLAHWLETYRLGDLWRMGELGGNP